MAFDVVIKDYNGDAQPVPVASNPPENTVLKSVRDHLNDLNTKLSNQASDIASLKSTLNDVEIDVESVDSGVEDVKDAISRQSYYRDMVYIDKPGGGQMSDSADLSQPVDAIICMSGGKLHVNTGKGERTVPVLAGVPHKCRITKVYNTDTTASEIVGYIEQ